LRTKCLGNEKSINRRITDRRELSSSKYNDGAVEIGALRPVQPRHLQGGPHGGRTPFYAVSVNGLHRDRVRVRDRVSGRVSVRVRDRVRVRACHLDSSGNLLTWRNMEFAPHRDRAPAKTI